MWWSQWNWLRKNKATLWQIWWLWYYTQSILRLACCMVGKKKNKHGNLDMVEFISQELPLTVQKKSSKLTFQKCRLKLRHNYTLNYATPSKTAVLPCTSRAALASLSRRFSRIRRFSSFNSACFSAFFSNSRSFQEISNRTHWTDPEKTWVSHSSSNFLRGPLVRSYSIFDGRGFQKYLWCLKCWNEMLDHLPG